MAMVIGLVLVLGLAGFFFLDRAARKGTYLLTRN